MYEIFHDLELIKVQNGLLSSLFHIDGATGALTGVSFAQNQKRLIVHEELQLIETDNGLFHMDGRHLSSLKGDMKIIPYQKKFLLVIEHHERVHVILWERNRVSRSFKCRGFAHNDMYFAVQQKRRWFVFNESDLIFEVEAETVELHHNFLVYASKENMVGLYDLKKHAFLLKNMKSIVASDITKFAIGIDLKKNAHIILINNRKHFSNVDDCGILSDTEQLFYLRKGKKCVLYCFDGIRIFKKEYPKGVDFVCYNEEYTTLLIINNNIAEFLCPE